ncbi:DNA repair metallo-beta-lactamase-domain-containing protein [Lineolata rhizophorae]|uniref:DNA repair metallo-beta-lactamase-domain-containing protein n=1 Tax=Lineolata rhizophorae TaxID=578093 RepID=A0A6A6P884_9PEZI|nr:DNA repair metallo-beta-lactamase-domain-containing protein [Lineolata rhizophorae]
MARGTPKPKPRPNGNIKSFFKKAEEIGSSLFVAGGADKGNGSVDKEADYGVEEIEWSAVDLEKFHEGGRSAKRRRVEELIGDENQATISGSGPEPDETCSPPPPENTAASSREADMQVGCEDRVPVASKKRRLGPFIEDSDSEDDMPTILAKGTVTISLEPSTSKYSAEKSQALEDESHPEQSEYVEGNGFETFDGSEEDFEDEDAFEGEELQERRWAELEERILTEGQLKDELDSEQAAQDFGESTSDLNGASEATSKASCPICSLSLSGISNHDASVHVNNCLDGNPTPLPRSTTEPKDALMLNAGSTVSPGKRAQRAERPAKPGQQNPFSLGTSSNGASFSAFSKLMSGHAEDAAWATAAAAESASRGKPSYQRTCPFYKILPGFSICVDAFRYGAVQGCEAYFLSHFHSDHYMGLTSSWSHGPIYCSKVTGNLVRQQLRVDPKWVVDLEFEAKKEVPGTNGVHVTMIPANHCPGSSLFLFEKLSIKGNYSRNHRVLHCGDFRACKAHVEHPLLSPETVDTLTGKTKQQKIDVCYLDTTYLNPKYAFPNQDEVINSCAEVCVSLNKTNSSDVDRWEQLKYQKSGRGLADFMTKGRKDSPAADEPKGASEDFVSTESQPQGRLLVVVGTYSIGKERVCLGIAKALNSKIYAPAAKQRICACLEDPELTSRLTYNPREAQVHLTPLFEIRAETLNDYLKDYLDRFDHAVGFRPSGWNYRPPNSRMTDNPSVQTVLHGSNWKSGYSVRDLLPQRGSTNKVSCFGVPYSEHSSFRELTMFCCALRIDKIIPTVNVGSAKSREKMKAWCEKWAAEKRKNGLFKPSEDSRW